MSLIKNLGKALFNNSPLKTVFNSIKGAFKAFGLLLKGKPLQALMEMFKSSPISQGLNNLATLLQLGKPKATAQAQGQNAQNNPNGYVIAPNPAGNTNATSNT